ncbi:glycosyltransferase [Pontibacter sp. H249]|uniref:glycosyltransferase n=1 Tax=Pontibacter sp. H249 TaxID=3133420 RepID=UPI0030BB53F5
MNIFIVPLWYPSKHYPIVGTFIKEQAVAIAKHDPDTNIGLSIWGQYEDEYLLWVKDHVRNFSKLLFTKRNSKQVKLAPNLTEYHHPTFTWTNTFLQGNLNQIVKANLNNAKAFELEYGKIDLIHAHPGYIAGAIALQLSQILGVPYIITEHLGLFPGPIMSDKSGNIKRRYKLPYLKSQLNITVSPHLDDLMLQQGIPNRVIVPNFLDEDLFTVKPGNRHNETNFTFLTVACINPEKGVDLLLKAIQIASKTHNNIKLRIAGTGPYLEEYKTLANTLGISSITTWLGEISRTEVVQELQHCNAFVLPSQFESMGIAYVEALACGKPIIATKCGGPEFTVNDNNGILVEHHTPKAVANAMLQIISSYSKYDKKTIREDFIKRFSKAAIIPKILDLYSKVTSNA